MRYFSCFSWIWWFELWITQAYEKMMCTPNTESMIQRAGDQERQSEQRSDICTEWLSCVWFSEIDKYAIQIYEKQFPSHRNFWDITKIDTATLPDFDCLVWGFPCQSFSIAGKRRGFEDTRGTLFFELARILRAKRPRLFVFENVKGLLSHDNGKTFSTIIATIAELGYDCQWQVLNSKNHWVPQNRERVFIVGHLRGTPRPKVFPIGEANSKDIEQLNFPKHSNDRVYWINGIWPTLNTMQWGMRQPFIAKTVRSGGRSSPHGSKQNWDSYDFEGRIRRLTPTECARLQWFPDNWCDFVSDSQKYKCLGNAVTVNVIRDIFLKINEQ